MMMQNTMAKAQSVSQLLVILICSIHLIGVTSQGTIIQLNVIS